MTTIENINDNIKKLNGNTDNISDGFHTFGELYKHRIHLFITLCKQLNNINILNKEISEICDTIHQTFIYMIKSKKHHDGSEFEGWFIVQLQTPFGQISYHLPNEYWETCYFITTLVNAEKWDGHSSDDILDRLLKI